MKAELPSIFEYFRLRHSKIEKSVNIMFQRFMAMYIFHNNSHVVICALLAGLSFMVRQARDRLDSQTHDDAMLERN